MSPFRNRNLLALTLTHFTNDFFGGTVPILLAAQTAPLGMTQAQIGMIALTNSLASSLAQPLFGLLADRARAPLLALAGMLWQASFIGLAGLANRFEVLLALVTVAGFGSAAFHPSGAGGVPRVSRPEQRGSSMSVFLLGGTSGYAVGPLLAGMVLDSVGSRGSLLFTLVAFLIAPLLLATLFNLRYMAIPSGQEGVSVPPVKGSAGISIMGVSMLALLVMFRSWASLSISTYLPQYFLAQGQTLVFAGQVSSILLLASAIGNLVAGFLSDRVGRHKVIIISLLGAVPLLYALLRVGSAWIFVVAAGLGFCLHASLPLTLLFGQEIIADRPGIMTGLTLGFTFIAGGIGSAVTGVLAEWTSLQTAFEWLPLLPFLSVLAATALSFTHRDRSRLREGDVVA